ncbi:MAG TPA: type IV pilin protein [Burkholderiaceae bacterium]|nr:type IV pilin protein [Burkholderiaceae bacterium]
MSILSRDLDLRLTNRSRGFTLIELMIVVAILAIVAAVALPSYFGSVRKSRRADAVAVMAQIQQSQERFRGGSATFGDRVGTYTSGGAFYAVAASGASAAGVSFGTSYTAPSGYYTFTLSNVTGTTYTITAVANGSQSKDTQCVAMQLRMSAGNATYVSSSSSSTVASASSDPGRCWNR